MKQTVLYKLNPTFEQERHLHNLCSIATKLYNTDNYQRREAWDKTGKIPNWYEQKKKLKSNHWYRLLSAQTAQAVIKNLQDAYVSWFRLRKTDKNAKPPRFRKKTILSPISFYQQFKIIGNKIRLSVSRKYSKENKIKFMKMEFIKWKKPEGVAKFCQIIFNKGKWFAHIVFEAEEPEINLNDNVMGIDLGIINTATTVDTEGNAKIYSGKQILAIQHYFNKEKAKLQSVLTKQYPKRHKSRTLNILQKKQNRQIKQTLHTHSKAIVDDCKKKNIKTIVVGDIKNIRKGKKWRKKENQKLHSWSFSKFTQQLEYKAMKAGIRFVRVSEAYTSQECSTCGTIRKSNRKHRGLYICKKCGTEINADVNGAKNILQKYLRDFLSRSIGKVALPSVTRLQNVVPQV